ncbi:unnamed protein product [Caenorhabditis angaria]|uniref:Uncharacterized protein n=1 Tax=Caenorhabditis angaria TaxID=860376 RepID=A0A9P1J345_9PELO|nr:unnamed protein product [Caenorhabditis angaria]
MSDSNGVREDEVEQCRGLLTVFRRIFCSMLRGHFEPEYFEMETVDLLYNRTVDQVNEPIAKAIYELINSSDGETDVESDYESDY